MGCRIWYASFILYITIIRGTYQIQHPTFIILHRMSFLHAIIFQFYFISNFAHIQNHVSSTLFLNNDLSFTNKYPPFNTKAENQANTSAMATAAYPK